MENEFVLLIKKHIVLICLIINQIICLILPPGHVFETPKLYVHLATLVVLMYLYIFNKAKFNFYWKPMLIFGILLGILYLMLNK